MNAGMVLFSHMGHTRQLGEALQQELEEAGHTVDLIVLETQEPFNLGADRTAIKPVPVVHDYDVLLLGSPVHGGRISAPMRAFLDEIEDFSGKPCVIFITHFLRRTWGAEQTMAEFVDKCREKGARILETCAVRWFSLQRKKHIQSAVHESVEAIEAL